MRTRIAFCTVVGLAVALFVISWNYRVDALAQDDSSDAERPADPFAYNGFSDSSRQETNRPGSGTASSKTSNSGRLGNKASDAGGRNNPSTRRPSGFGAIEDEDESGLEAAYGDDEADQTSQQQQPVRIIRLRNVRAREILGVARTLFTDSAEESRWFITADAQSNSVVFKGPDDVFEQVRRLANELDQVVKKNDDMEKYTSSFSISRFAEEDDSSGGEDQSTADWWIRILRLRHARSDELRSIAIDFMRSQDQDYRIRIESEPMTNSIVMRGPAEQLDQIARLAEQLDQPSIAVSDARYVDSLFGPDQSENSPDDIPDERSEVQQSERFRQQAQRLDQESLTIANEVRALQKQYGSKHPTIIESNGKLRAVLEQAFEIRLKLQEMEVASLKNKLRQIESRVHRRAELRQQIVDRRFHELLGQQDEYDWEVSKRSQPSSFSANDIEDITGEDLPIEGVNIGLPPGGSLPDTLTRQLFQGRVSESPASIPVTVSEPGRQSGMNVALSPDTGFTGTDSQRELIVAEYAVKAATLNVEKVKNRLSKLKDSDAEEEVLYDLQLATLELEQAQRLLEQKERLVDVIRKSFEMQIAYCERNVESVIAEYKAALSINERTPRSVPDTEIQKLKLAVDKAHLLLEQAKAKLHLLDIRKPDSDAAPTSDEDLNLEGQS